MDAMEGRPGVCFNPTDAQLLLQYLKPVVEGGQPPLPIPTLPVYDLEPWELPPGYPAGGGHGGAQQSSFYCFARRRRCFQDGKRVQRAVGGGGGTWHGNKVTQVVAGGAIVGYDTLLSFQVPAIHQGDADPQQQPQQRRGRKKLATTGWVMHELSLAGGEEFQDVVICKIRNRKPAGGGGGFGCCRKRRRGEEEELVKEDVHLVKASASDDHAWRGAASEYGLINPRKKAEQPYNNVTEIPEQTSSLPPLVSYGNRGTTASAIAAAADNYVIYDAADDDHYSMEALLALSSDGFELCWDEAELKAVLSTLLPTADDHKEAMPPETGLSAMPPETVLSAAAADPSAAGTAATCGAATSTLPAPTVDGDVELLPWDEDYETAMATLARIWS